MRQDGFSLIELVIVVAILSTLLSIATLEFGKYQRKQGIEGQVRIMFTDLMTVRSQALYEKRDRAVTIASTTFSVYSSGTASGAPVLERTLPYPVTFSVSTPLKFNSRGVIEGAKRSICIDSDNEGSIDSLVVSTTRIQMGKREGACDADDITPR